MIAVAILVGLVILLWAFGRGVNYFAETARRRRRPPEPPPPRLLAGELWREPLSMVPAEALPPGSTAWVIATRLFTMTAEPLVDVGFYVVPGEPGSAPVLVPSSDITVEPAVAAVMRDGLIELGQRAA